MIRTGFDSWGFCLKVIFLPLGFLGAGGLCSSEPFDTPKKNPVSLETVFNQLPWVPNPASVMAGFLQKGLGQTSLSFSTNVKSPPANPQSSKFTGSPFPNSPGGEKPIGSSRVGPNNPNDAKTSPSVPRTIVANSKTLAESKLETPKNTEKVVWLFKSDFYSPAPIEKLVQIGLPNAAQKETQNKEKQRVEIRLKEESKNIQVKEKEEKEKKDRTKAEELRKKELTESEKQKALLQADREKRLARELLEKMSEMEKQVKAREELIKNEMAAVRKKAEDQRRELAQKQLPKEVSKKKESDKENNSESHQKNSKLEMEKINRQTTVNVLSIQINKVFEIQETGEAFTLKSIMAPTSQTPRAEKAEISKPTISFVPTPAQALLKEAEKKEEPKPGPNPKVDSALREKSEAEKRRIQQNSEIEARHLMEARENATRKLAEDLRLRRELDEKRMAEENRAKLRLMEMEQKRFNEERQKLDMEKTSKKIEERTRAEERNLFARQMEDLHRKHELELQKRDQKNRTLETGLRSLESELKEKQFHFQKAIEALEVRTSSQGRNSSGPQQHSMDPRMDSKEREQLVILRNKLRKKLGSLDEEWGHHQKEIVRLKQMQMEVQSRLNKIEGELARNFRPASGPSVPPQRNHEAPSEIHFQNRGENESRSSGPSQIPLRREGFNLENNENQERIQKLERSVDRLGNDFGDLKQILNEIRDNQRKANMAPPTGAPTPFYYGLGPIPFGPMGPNPNQPPGVNYSPPGGRSGSAPSNNGPSRPNTRPNSGANNPKPMGPDSNES